MNISQNIHVFIQKNTRPTISITHMATNKQRQVEPCTYLGAEPRLLSAPQKLPINKSNTWEGSDRILLAF